MRRLLLLILSVSFLSATRVFAQGQGTVQPIPDLVTSMNVPMFNPSGPGANASGFIPSEKLSNDLRFYRATAIGPQVTALEPHFGNPLSLAQTVRIGLEKLAALQIQDPARFQFQTGPLRSIGGSLLTGEIASGLDWTLGPQKTAGFQDAALRVQQQAEAKTNPKLNQELNKIAEIVSSLNKRGETLSTGNPRLAKLNRFWDQTGNFRPADLRDAANSRTALASADLSRVPVNAQSAFPETQFPPEPFRLKPARGAIDAKAEANGIPEIKVENLDTFLLRLRKQSEVNNDFGSAAIAALRDHSKRRLKLDPANIFLIREDDRQEPKLLTLLTAGISEDAAGYLRTMTDGKQDLLILIVTKSPAGLISREEFKKTIDAAVSRHLPMENDATETASSIKTTPASTGRLFPAIPARKSSNSIDIDAPHASRSRFDPSIASIFWRTAGKVALENILPGNDNDPGIAASRRSAAFLLLDVPTTLNAAIP